MSRETIHFGTATHFAHDTGSIQFGNYDLTFFIFFVNIWVNMTKTLILEYIY